jgi:hypothetical protein
MNIPHDPARIRLDIKNPFRNAYSFLLLRRGLVNFLSRLAWNLDPPDLHLSSS